MHKELRILCIQVLNSNVNISIYKFSKNAYLAGHLIELPFVLNKFTCNEYTEDNTIICLFAWTGIDMPFDAVIGVHFYFLLTFT